MFIEISSYDGNTKFGVGEDVPSVLQYEGLTISNLFL